MENLIESLNNQYRQDSAAFEFNCSMYIAGKQNAAKRQQIIKFCTGSDVPKSKAGYYYTVQVLKNKFDQPELF